jgi:hypothetical protein
MKKWTKDRPTKPGYYWHTNLLGNKKIVEITSTPRGLVVHYPGMSNTLLLDLIWTGEWISIKEPE